MAKYYEMGSGDVLVTVGTDSMEMYGSRLVELNEERGEFTSLDAAASFHRYMLGAGIDHVQELSYYDRKRIHNLKYYTWVEQQGKTYEEIQAQWYDPDYWTVDPSDGRPDRRAHRRVQRDGRLGLSRQLARQPYDPADATGKVTSVTESVSEFMERVAATQPGRARVPSGGPRSGRVGLAGARPASGVSSSAQILDRMVEPERVIMFRVPWVGRRRARSTSTADSGSR